MNKFTSRRIQWSMKLDADIFSTYFYDQPFACTPLDNLIIEHLSRSQGHTAETVHQYWSTLNV